MGSHTPKREAIERFISKHPAAPGIQIRVVDEQENPVIWLQASGGGPNRSLEIHTRQITLTNDALDPSTRKMIERWLDSLHAGAKS